MKQPWMAVAGLMIATTVAAASWAEQGSNQVPLTDAEGKGLAMVLLCNDCRSETDSDCRNGAADGWLDGKACGSCLLKANTGVLIRYPFDVLVLGRLIDPDGAPVKDRFVKLLLPNGWGVRTRTNDTGDFRLNLGATAERVSQEVRMVNVGTHIDTTKGEDPHFAIYMMPEEYKVCSAEDAPPQAAKGGTAAKGSKGKSAKPKK